MLQCKLHNAFYVCIFCISEPCHLFVFSTGDYINAFVHRDEIYVNVHTKWRGGDSILYTHHLDNFSWIRLSHINMDSCLHHKLLFSL